MTKSGSRWAAAAALMAACDASPTGRTGVHDAGDEPTDLPSLRTRTLDSLSVAQAETLCREDAERFDPCLEVGLATGTADACTEAVAACRASAADGSGDFECRGYELGPRGSCTVSVDEYLSCVDTWNEHQRCDDVGVLIETPEACRPVVTGCPRLASRFFRNGAPPPCSEETESRPPRKEEDIYGFDGCRPTPARFLILGDSIAACAAVLPTDCGPMLIGEYVEQTFAPGMTIEQHAVGGAVMADLPGQARGVEGGPGHVVVWVHILGNDLALRNIDEEAWKAAWQATFDRFTDPAAFPDGATFLLNTQFSPYDQCPEPLGGGLSISVEADQLLQELNHRVFVGLAEERPDTVTIDQYPDWLGHGNHANVRACPHCGSDNTSWMAFDDIHPNALGYANMAAKWRVALDRMYGAACGVR